MWWFFSTFLEQLLFCSRERKIYCNEKTTTKIKCIISFSNAENISFSYSSQKALYFQYCNDTRSMENKFFEKSAHCQLVLENKIMILASQAVPLRGSKSLKRKWGSFLQLAKIFACASTNDRNNDASLIFVSSSNCEDVQNLVAFSLSCRSHVLARLILLKVREEPMQYHFDL